MKVRIIQNFSPEIVSETYEITNNKWFFWRSDFSQMRNKINYIANFRFKYVISGKKLKTEVSKAFKEP